LHFPTSRGSNALLYGNEAAASVRLGSTSGGAILRKWFTRGMRTATRYSESECRLTIRCGNCELFRPIAFVAFAELSRWPSLLPGVTAAKSGGVHRRAGGELGVCEAGHRCAPRLPPTTPYRHGLIRLTAFDGAWKCWSNFLVLAAVSRLLLERDVEGWIDK